MCGQNEAVDGHALCVGCIAENDRDAESIERLIRQGHTQHCACRLVWGDGECECGKKGPMTEERLNGIIEAVKRELR
jgi:hypothetical protein